MNILKQYLATSITISRIPVAFVYYYIIYNNKFTLVPMLFICLIYIEISDMLDGFVARKLKIVSNLGKILDPAADVTSHFLCILALDNTFMIPKIVLPVFVLREYWILLLRSQLIHRGIVLAAGISGKIKTVLYATSLIATMLFFPSTAFAPYLIIYKPIIHGLWYVATITSLLSALHYSIIAWLKTNALKKNSNATTTNKK